MIDTFRRRAALALLGPALVLAVVPAPALAAGKSPYADLFPAKMVIQDATDRLDPQMLKQSRLGIVVSSRFLKQMTAWQKRYGENGDKRPGSFGFWGVSRQSANIAATAMDPRRVIDEVIARLDPRFAAIEVFDDLAAARESGVQYFMVIDYDGSASPDFMGIGGGVNGKAGALFLNAGLQRVFEVGIEKATKWYAAPLLGGANSNVLAVAKSIEANFDALLPALNDEIDGAFAARGAPVPAAAPPPMVLAAAAAAGSNPELDAAFAARFAAATTAGELYALGDEMAERGDRPKAVQAFRSVLTRFPDNVLAAKAADRLAEGTH